MNKVKFEDLCEYVPQDQLAPIDRDNAVLSTPDEWDWNVNGYVVKRNFIPHDLIDAYVKRRQFDGEYMTGHPYMRVEEIKDLCCYSGLADLLKSLIGEDMGMHLNLCGWVSTERNWHQDTYLNPDNINTYYAAVWFALDDINLNAGPFQYVPGSHLWPTLRRDKVRAMMDPIEAAKPSWPAVSQNFVSAAMMDYLERRNKNGHRYIIREFHPASKGDIFIWHSKLMHRGSPPKIPGLERRAIITHYSALSKRIDMPHYQRHKEQGYYFVL